MNITRIIDINTITTASLIKAELLTLALRLRFIVEGVILRLLSMS